MYLQNVRIRKRSVKIIITEMICTHLSEVPNHFSYQRPHGGNINNFEVICVDRTVSVNVFPDFSQHCEQRYVGFTSTLKGPKQYRYNVG